MSRVARSLQRPPRSRASASRTSFQTCSESISTPSRSNTTASITGDTSHRAVLAVDVDERRRRRTLLERDDLGDEERVVARAQLVDVARDDPADRVDEQARVVRAHDDPVPLRDRRNRAGEVLRDAILVAPEQ